MKNETFKTKITFDGKVLREISIELPIPETASDFGVVFGPHWAGYAARGGCRVAVQGLRIKRLMAQGHSGAVVKQYGAAKGGKLTNANIVDAIQAEGGAFLPERKRGTGTGGFSGVLKAAKVGGLSAGELAELVKVAIAAKGSKAA